MIHVSSRSPTSDRAGDGHLVRCVAVGRAYPGREPGWFGAGGGRTAVQALEDVSFTVDRSEYVSLIGPSGSGKTTLVHLLAGLDTPTAGTVEFDGRDVAALADRARTRLRLERIGLVFQRFHLLSSLSARSNVALPLLERGVDKRTRRQRATTLLERVGLGDRVDHRPAELSGGEQQRVAVARALANDPDLLLADEPTGELDTETGQRILDLFADLADDHAVVVASHDDRVSAAADRVLRLRDGRLADDD